MLRTAPFVLVAACSVPDVDLSNKTCPCASGYTCVANQCERTTGSDGGSPVSCLGTTPGTSLYSDNFDAATIDAGWVTTSMWAQTGGELVQSDPNDQLAFAYTTRVTATSYRVVAQMTTTATGMGMGIAVRAAPGAKTQYDCLWLPGGTATLLWQWTNNGGVPSTYTTQIGLPSSMTVTMEVTAIGTELRCCIDNIAGANVTVSNPSPSYATGQPGVVTDRTRASFDNFAVYAN